MSDIVIRGGRVVDPSQGLDRVADVAISGGRIREIAPVVAGGGELIDARGCIVAPGASAGKSRAPPWRRASCPIRSPRTSTPSASAARRTACRG